MTYITELEKAIEIYTDNVEQMKLNPDVFSDDLPRFELILNILLKKQRSIEGCEYCNDMKYFELAEHEVYIDGNGKLDIDNDEDIQLNICPMCGREL